MRCPPLLCLSSVLFLAVACGGKSSGADAGGSDGGTPGGDGGMLTSGNPIGLWMSGLFSLSAAQLLDGGSPTPSDECLDPSDGASTNPAVFDGQGDLWVQTAGGSTLSMRMWTPGQLGQACTVGSPTRTVSFSKTGASLDQMTAMAFDAQGTLWLTDTDDQELFGLSSSQLASSGTVQATYLVQAEGTGAPAAQLAAPMGLAVDATGNLWVANTFSVLEYSAASLATTNGTPGTSATMIAPTAFLSTPASELGAQNGGGVFPTFEYVAFDATGNLWVSGANAPAQTPGEYVAEYTPAQLSALATNATPTPTVTILESATQMAASEGFGAIAFDAAGNLWVGANADLFRYPASALTANGTGTYDLALTNLYFFTFRSLAFDPIPAGLPLQP